MGPRPGLWRCGVGEWKFRRVPKMLRVEIIAADEADGPEFKVADIRHGEPNFQCSNDGLLVPR